MVGVALAPAPGARPATSFALPVDGVAGLVRHMLRHGKVQRASLGITLAPRGMLPQVSWQRPCGALVWEMLCLFVVGVAHARCMPCMHTREGEGGAHSCDKAQGNPTHSCSTPSKLAPIDMIPAMLVQLGLEGALVLEVPAGSPAAAAGLRPSYRDVFGEVGGWVCDGSSGSG